MHEKVDYRRIPRCISSLLTLALALIGGGVPGVAEAAPVAPKVLVITMFKHEVGNWLEKEALEHKTAIDGLSEAFPDLSCNDKGLCLITTSVGYANAASSVSVLVLSDEVDLSKTYILIAGIAGIDPQNGTLGSAMWARYAVDGGLQWRIDDRKVLDEWTSGQFGMFAKAQGEKPGSQYGTEVYHLNEALTGRAFELSKDVELADSDGAKAYRQNYPEEAAKAASTVGICDTVSADQWRHGVKLSAAMNDWAKLLTNGAADYCTTQQEGNATLTALARGAKFGRVDMDRVAILRTASNFDQPYPGQVPQDSINANSGGFGPALTNAYRVGKAFSDAVIGDWDAWAGGIPAK
ncbi:purine nucleoside permease [Breoghania sp.]|uniref:purine-nucleoside phosphorylase n=1 Tax=Breoghania sp. TaxID=2065378 RepID=UPI0026181FCE|nr:purine nucleoside permease [Breoghania sp.]MDJ0932068.1 purine nucleoside permease [Breoghania sp.]